MCIIFPIYVLCDCDVYHISYLRFVWLWCVSYFLSTFCVTVMCIIFPIYVLCNCDVYHIYYLHLPEKITVMYTDTICLLCSCHKFALHYNFIPISLTAKIIYATKWRQINTVHDMVKTAVSLSFITYCFWYFYKLHWSKFSPTYSQKQSSWQWHSTSSHGQWSFCVCLPTYLLSNSFQLLSFIMWTR